MFSVLGRINIASKLLLTLVPVLAAGFIVASLFSSQMLTQTMRSSEAYKIAVNAKMGSKNLNTWLGLTDATVQALSHHPAVRELLTGEINQNEQLHLLEPTFRA